MQRLPLIAIIGSSLLLGACASQPQGLKELRTEASREALTTGRSGTTITQEAAQLAESAQAQETWRFAPVLTREAAASLEAARDAASKGRGDDEVRVQALAAAATYQRAIEHTLVARETLAPSLAHLEVLNTIGSATYYPSDYQSVNDGLNRIIATLETTAEPASAVQTQRQLLSEMHALEVNTIGFIQLQPVRNTVAELDAADAATLIPQSFATARKALASAEDLVRKSPRAEGGIASLREQAETAAAHARVILSMVNEVLNADKDSAESLVLRTERWLYNISTALKFPDIRHLPMDEQSRQLAEGVEEVVQR